MSIGKEHTIPEKLNFKLDLQIEKYPFILISDFNFF